MNPIARELLAMFDRAVRDPLQLVVLVLLFVLIGIAIAAASGWAFDAARRAYRRRAVLRERRQEARFHEAAREERLNRIVRISDRTGHAMFGRR